MHVEQDDVRDQRVNGGDGALDVVGLAHDLQVGGMGGELGAHAGAHEGVVIDDEDAQGGGGSGIGHDTPWEGAVS